MATVYFMSFFVLYDQLYISQESVDSSWSGMSVSSQPMTVAHTTSLVLLQIENGSECRLWQQFRRLAFEVFSNEVTRKI